MLNAIIRERYIKKSTVSKNMDMFTRIWGKKPDEENDGTENKRPDNVKSLFNKHSWDAADVEETVKLPFTHKENLLMVEVKLNIW
jgi:hypothetical protein